ncbi:hypothetical protein ACHAXS_000532 [Conticribra weissflogii]
MNVNGRYRFIYVSEDEDWKIITTTQRYPKMKTRTRSNFGTPHVKRDPDTVAKRFAKNTELLANVFDIPRTNYGLIKDYFVVFLEGEILESRVLLSRTGAKM